MGERLGSLGTVKLLPPILTAQWHFLPRARIRPYVGAGINGNFFFDESGTLDAIDAEIDDQIGFVAQGGVDIDLTEGVFLNIDGKFLHVDTDVTTDLGEAELTLDGGIFGSGLGARF